MGGLSAGFCIQLSLILAGFAGGLAVAMRAGPIVFGWTSYSGSLIRHRLTVMAAERPLDRARNEGLYLLLGLLAGGLLVAYAAYPAQRDVSEISAVHALFSNKPPGPLVQPAPRLAPGDAALIAQEKAAGRWDGTAKWGFSLSETRRLVAYDARRNATYQAWYIDHWARGELQTGNLDRPSEAQAVGENYEDYRNLADRRMAYEAANIDQEMAARPITGKSRLYVPLGLSPVAAMAAQGVDSRGSWRLGAPDETGGRVATRVGPASFNTAYLVDGVTPQPEGYVTR